MRIFVLFFCLLSFTASAECLSKYQRTKYPHWERLPASSGYQDVRQKVIADSVVSDLKIVNGRVVGGLWYDPFSGRNYWISDVTPDIDHIVSLKWAHERGAKCWSYRKRKQFANDTLNLWPVHPSANRQKGSDVSGWLPANLGMCTDYLKQVKRVIRKYELEPNQQDIKRYNLAVKKCRDWRNGIKIKKVKRWYEFWRLKNE